MAAVCFWCGDRFNEFGQYIRHICSSSDLPARGRISVEAKKAKAAKQTEWKPRKAK